VDGAGLANRSAIEELFSEATVEEVMRKIKLALDPRLVMNPGEVHDLGMLYPETRED